MSVDKLKERIAKSEENVEKAKRSLDRNQKQMAKLQSEGITGIEIKFKEDDIKRAERKVSDAEKTHQNWIEKLQVEVNKQNYLNDIAPQVIKDFLEEWKKLAVEWNLKRYEEYKNLKEKLRADREEVQLDYVLNGNDIYYDSFKGADGKLKVDKNFVLNMVSKELKLILEDKKLTHGDIRKKLDNHSGGLIKKMDEYKDKDEREKFVNDVIEKEKVQKMLDLISRISSVVGEIQDASDLTISGHGDLNGVVIGNAGQAKVETISAGGWNIQCFHYRTLVTKL